MYGHFVMMHFIYGKLVSKVKTRSGISYVTRPKGQTPQITQPLALGSVDLGLGLTIYFCDHLKRYCLLFVE